MPQDILPFGHQLQILGTCLLLAIAFWKGDSPEKLCNLVGGLTIILDIIYHIIFGHAVFNHIDIGHLVIDSLAALAFLLIATQANRMYPLWLASWQMIAVTAHLIRLVDPAISRPVYGVMIIAPSYAEMLILATGLFLHIRRVKIHGSYRSWRRSTNPSSAIFPSARQPN